MDEEFDRNSTALTNSTYYDNICRYTIPGANGSTKDSVSVQCSRYEFDRENFDETIVTQV